MKLKAFTIAESIMVLALSAIVFYLVLNAHQLINSVYTVYVDNGNKIESIVELQKILHQESFRCEEMKIENGVLTFRHSNSRVTQLSITEEKITLSYADEQAVVKKMEIDAQMRILDAVDEEGYLSSLLLELNFEEELHKITIHKKYTSEQKLARLP